MKIAHSSQDHLTSGTLHFLPVTLHIDGFKYLTERYVRMKIHNLFSLAGLLLVAGGASAQSFSISITVDENGNGTFTNTSGFFATLPFALLPDPGPGGLSSALTYGFLNPPGLV